MGRTVKTETRKCAQCGEEFACRADSIRQFCGSHTGGVGKLNSKPAEPVDLPAELEKYLLTRVPLQPVPARIQAVRREEMGFDTEQEAIALFSDYHYGSKIDKRVSAGLAEYNPDIARIRLTRWRDGVLRFTQQDQYLLKVKRLNIFELGDTFEGHGAMFPTQGLQMDMALGFQVVDFVDDMTGVLITFTERYDEIEVWKVPGNHGRIADRARAAYPPDNAELFAWQMIAERLTRSYNDGKVETDELGVRHYSGGPFRFHVTPSFIMFPRIFGFNFALRHGHGIKGIQATYTGALDNMLRLNAITGQNIHYYIKAHLHEAQASESIIQGELIQNGCFVGPSLLSVEMSRAAASLPSQEMFLLHPQKGKTNSHRITLADVSEVRQMEFLSSRN